MAWRDTMLTSRRLRVTVSVLFGLFVLFDVALFSWLILNSLSQRELEKILVETQEEAEPLARQLMAKAEQLDQDDLFVVVSVAEETKKYLGTVLLEREIVHSVQIKKQDGTVVFEQSNQESSPGEIQRPLGGSEGGGLQTALDVPRVERADLEAGGDRQLKAGYETEVPIGELGSLVIGVSEEVLLRRVGVLRRDLARQASVLGGITVALLGAAFATMLALFKRADRLEKQAEEAERMAMIGTLASGLAHEIRNPLNSLNLNMQMLGESRRRDGSEKRLLSITRSEISRLENLVTDFLSYAKPRPIERQEIGAAELFERAAEVLSGQIRASGTEVSIRDETGGRGLAVDRDQMGQLLLNLMQNALAATAEVERAGRIELAARNAAAGVALEVGDNGCGIPEDEQPKIFDLFYSTRKGGTGLGLAIAERIARSHGAEIEAESIPGEGTTIRVLLPSPPPGPRSLPRS